MAAASFPQDVARVLDVLRANAVENKIDPEGINALLNLYAADEQRVDLVLLDLQGIVGKELSMGSQQQRSSETLSVDILLPKPTLFFTPFIFAI